MTFSEITKDYFKQLDTQFTLFPENTVKTFNDLDAFYDFLIKETDFWKECNMGHAEEIRSFFNDRLNKLDFISTIDMSNLNNHARMEDELSSLIASFKRNNFPVVFSGTTLGKIIREKFKESYLQANAICDYFFYDTITSLNNIEYLRGILYSFYVRDSKIAFKSEINSENKALSELHNEYNEKIEELHNKYLEKNKEANTLVENYQDKITKQLNKMNVDEANQIQNNETKLTELIDKLNELQDLYENKLSLAAPADYWKKLSDNYKDRGRRWVIFSSILSFILCGFLAYILYYLPNSLREVNNKITYDNIKGTIIFALIVSVGVYVIRLFVKLALSSYHLSRDAKEREQLTYVYLALLKEKAVATEERNIVLQAIFSRSDTGLLKGDSSPTLPDGVVSQILKNIGK